MLKLKTSQMAPKITAEESAKRLAEVRKGVSKDLWTTKESRERILKEAFSEHRDKKKKHKMSSYRVEVQFGTRRSVRGDSIAIVRVWESGKDLQGKGDVSMHFCDNPKCLKPFSGMLLDGDVVVCPHCFTTTKRENCGSAIGPARFKIDDLCTIIQSLFSQFKGDCDVVSLWIKESPMKALGEVTKHFDQIEAYQEKHWDKVVYPYWRILEDTMYGKTLFQVLKEFLG